MDATFRLGPWLVQPQLNTISRNGTAVQLEPKVMSVLVCLAEHAGEPVSKEQLLKTVWPDTFVGEGVLTRSIFELRRVFEDQAKEPQFIQTIAKRGYRLVAPVVTANGPGTPPRTRLPDQGHENGGPSHREWTWRLAMAGSVVLLIAAPVAFNIGKLRERALARTSVPQIHSLAVLPLKNLSGDSSQEYFADGMTDELITYLSQISSLRVISHTSTNRYKDTKKSLPEIARELGVDGVVEGSVQRGGGRVRVNAQLVYAPQEAHLWAQSYDRDLLDALAVQSEVAEAIADEVKIKLTRARPERLRGPRPVNLEVLDTYLQGVYHLSRIGRGFGAEENRKAIESFRGTIAQDPGFAPAYVKLVESYENEAFPYPVESLPLQRAAVEKALSLDPDSASAHVALGNIRFCRDWDWSGAEAEFTRALALNSNDPLAHESFAFYLEAMGRLEEGMRERQSAQVLDPAGDYVSVGFYFRRNYDEGIELVKRRVEILPNDGGIHFLLSAFYERKRMERESIEEFERGAALYGFEEGARHIDHAFSTSGYRGALCAKAKEAEAAYRQGKHDRPDVVAGTYVSLGDTNKAFHWLEVAYQEHSAQLITLNVDPLWDPLRNDPRFHDLLRRVGLPQ